MNSTAILTRGLMFSKKQPRNNSCFLQNFDVALNATSKNFSTTILPWPTIAQTFLLTWVSACFSPLFAKKTKPSKPLSFVCSVAPLWILVLAARTGVVVDNLLIPGRCHSNSFIVSNFRMMCGDRMGNPRIAGMLGFVR